MLTITPRRVAALLMVLTLLAAAVPALAAPLPSLDGEPAASGSAPSFVEALFAWLAGIWPVLGLPAAAREGSAVPDAKLASSLRGDDGQATGGGAGTESTSDEPTAEPQLGPGLDPGG